MRSPRVDRMIQLYRRESKHSAYQRLAPSVSQLLGNLELGVRNRHEESRLSAILSGIPLLGMNIVDIGGNTGYFTFSAIEHGAKRVDYFDGASAHSEFVREAAAELGLEDKVAVHDEYFDFHSCAPGRYDVCFCLNVLHHVGDDFGDKVISMDRAKCEVLYCINALARNCQFMALQLGFNWKGDIRHPLFPHGTKQEMIDFITSGTTGCWSVTSVCVAGEEDGAIKFSPADNRNLQRFDHLGEFLNRPLFFMTSRVF